MELRPANANDLRQLATMAAALQRRPERHVTYLGFDAAGIETDLDEATWRESSVVASDESGEIAGWLVGDVDDEMGRVWWLGPFVRDDAWEPLAGRLLDEARRRLPDHVTEEEMAVDERFERFDAWATAQGFSADTGSWVLTLDRRLAPPKTRSDVEFRAAVEADHDQVARIHDEVFPGTHSTGARLVDQSDAAHPRLVAVDDDTVLGYIAVERQADGGGYIDYVGVAPPHRRRGLGGDLVRAGVAALASIGAERVHLTVRDDSEGARELYASLGFTEERLVRPYRKGFTLD